tara:strand:- start:765 stop:1850 length:1086 start_codon:yes stop_codon:yes gene_type:complete
MKILQVIPSLKKGGAERITLEICSRLNQIDGYSTLIVFFEGKNEYEELYPDVKTVKVRTNVQISLTKKNKIDVSQLQKVVSDFQPDIVNSHLYRSEFLISLCDLNGAKWFSHIHGFAPEYRTNNHWKKKITLKYERFLINKNRSNVQFIAVSENIGKFMSRFNAKAKIHMLENGIDLEKFKKSDNDRSFTFCSVGSLVENKNHDFLLKVLKSLNKKRNENHPMIIVGDGPERKKLKSYISEHNLIVELVGKTNEVAKYLNQGKIYLHASRREAFGLTILEAMACGLPGVTLDGGGNSQLVKTNYNGFLIKEENIDEFVKCIESLLDNNKLFQEMSRNAVETAENFGIDAYISKLIKIYSNN